MGVLFYFGFLFLFCFIFFPPSPLHCTRTTRPRSLSRSLAALWLSLFLCVSHQPLQTERRFSFTGTHKHTHTQAHWLWSLPGETGTEERSEEDSSGHTQTHRAGGWAKEWPDPLCNALLTFPCNRTHTHTHTGYTGVVAGQQQQHCSQTGPNPPP